jgi:serine/threonine protein kinase
MNDQPQEGRIIPEGEQEKMAEKEWVEGGSTLSNSRNVTTPYSSTTDLCKQLHEKAKKRMERDVSVSNINDAADNNYGAPLTVQTSGNFPAVGSTLGPFFCVGRLGSGTFASIHKCINLDYFHNRGKDKNGSFPPPLRVAAAKVEIGDFKGSGVLGGEASILHFLHSVLPEHTVPVYMGHYCALQANDVAGGPKEQRSQLTTQEKPSVASAIVMEYLPGQDMHVIRDWATRQSTDQPKQQSTGNRRRRIAVTDAVYLTAHVMLPLLQRMHSVGIVHRDVKPSNVVKRAGTASSRDFCMVDFGLSKSIVVPQDSSLADLKHVWQGKHWMKPHGTMDVPISSEKVGACYRKERSTADFRGTSMYASVRVHQLKDYCPRDDIWSLMYVFCDLVSGGLPWMSHAANRDRSACQKIKERIHGMKEQTDGRIATDTNQLLMGDEYHVALFKKYKGGIDPPPNDIDKDSEEDSPLPTPFELSKDVEKTKLLDTSFEHLKSLNFTDLPDYELIRKCLEGFLDGSESLNISGVLPIDWNAMSEAFQNMNTGGTEIIGTRSSLIYDEVPIWELPDVKDSIQEVETQSMFADTDPKQQNSKPDEAQAMPLHGEAADLARLPLEMRFRIAQMDYNALNHSTIEPPLALQDWLKVALPLLYGTWDTKEFEKGGHRSDNDGYRRECFLRVADKCIQCAKMFQEFREKSCFFESDSTEETPPKRRRIHCTAEEPNNFSLGSDLLTISRVLFELRMVKQAEERLPCAPPPLLSFGS